MTENTRQRKEKGLIKVEKCELLRIVWDVLGFDSLVLIAVLCSRM